MFVSKYRIATSFGTKRGKVGDMTPICVVKLVMALSNDVQDKLAKRVDDCYWRRLFHERLTRRTIINTISRRPSEGEGSTGGGDIGGGVGVGDAAYMPSRLIASPMDPSFDLLDGGVARQESLESSASTLSTFPANSNPSDSGKDKVDDNMQDRALQQLTKQDSLSIDGGGSGSVMLMPTPLVLNANDVAVNEAINAFISMPMDDMDELGNTIKRIEDDNGSLSQQPSVTEVKASAATAIQRLARGADARNLAERRYQNVSFRS